MNLRLSILFHAGLVVPEPALGQATEHRDGLDSVTVVADSTFGHGALRRFLLGTDYRDLWATPIRVEVLDLQRFAGGLKPLRRGSGQQTVSLRLEGADGREYQFRLLRKDLQIVGPRSAEGDRLALLLGMGREDFRGTFVGGVVRDQISAIHPGGSLMLPPILEAAGVLHAPPRLRYMPDDPGLGEFRAEFANQLGTIEERPTADDDGPAFAGAEEVRSTEDFLKKLDEEPWIRVDTRAYLTARLLDFFVGDWDRHEDQWRWALLGKGDSARWHPIPRDRDYAFVRYDGLLMGLVRYVSPKLLVFNEEYASPWAASFNGRHLDRRILNDLEWPVWDSVSSALQSRLTDQVLDLAVKQLPPEWEARNGAFLRRTLRIRRDNLHRAAERYFRFLAEQVIVYAGQENDWADVIRQEGVTEVQVGRAGSERPYYTRRFTRIATDEVRIVLGDGDDRAIVRGEGRGPKVRLIGGGGQDTLIDRSRYRNTHFYDAGDLTVAEGRKIDRKPYDPPVDTAGTPLPEQDWGQFVWTMPMVEISSDVGLSLGMGVTRKGYGFRRQPYASLHKASLERSFLRDAFRFQGSMRWRAVNRQTYYGFSLLGSGIEGLRFYGFGNATAGDSPIGRNRFLVFQEAYELSPYLGFGLEAKAKLLLMLRARHTVTDLSDPTNATALIDDLRPLGVGDFGQLGPAARFEYDSRNYRFGATKGLHLVVDGDYYPLSWAGDGHPFGSVEGVISTYVTPVGSERLALALRAGGRRVWGEFPYFGAAFLGGKSDLRGYPRNRFAGRSSVFGNVELRIVATEIEVFLPAELGIFGLADAGRVFFEDEPPGRWHTDFGGGVTLGFIQRRAGFTIGVARGDEGTRFHLMFGSGY